MSKNNYNVILIANTKLGPIGNTLIMKKGYARFLYKQKKVLPIVRKSKIVDEFIVKAYRLIDQLKTLTDITLYRESKAFIIKKPIMVQAVIKELAKKINNKDLGQLLFKLPNIMDYGSYTLEIFYQSKLVHTIEVIISNSNEK